jgi:hypothetical protein
MTSTTHLAMPPHEHPGPEQGSPAPLPRIWPPLVVLAVFWAAYSLWRWTELGASLGFLGFLMLLAIGGAAALLFVLWWLAASRVSWRERLAVLAAAALAGGVACFYADRRLGPFLLVPGLPLVLSLWALGVLAARRWPSQARSLGLISLLCLGWGAFLLLRGEGMGGDGQIALRWRWALTAEQLYLAELAQEDRTGSSPLTLDSRHAGSPGPGDWPGFRGPHRDGTVRAVRIATDWNAAPKLVWKRRIGPAWSSAVVVGERLYTQEQVGNEEAVVCLDAASGRTLWSHRDEARHEDVQGGAGPRATPTFAQGRIFALGATGLLNCLDAETGARLWARDIVADVGTKVPMWGCSSSPLVAGEVVIVFAGGESDRTLLAYRTDSGKPAWSAEAGKISYSSPQLARISGKAQLLFVGDQGLFAYEPSSGAPLWHHPTPAGNPGLPRAVQPHSFGPAGVLFDAGPDLGTALVQVAQTGGSWVATEQWVSRQLKPSFNDFVIHGNSLYGFDGRVLTCVDLESGRRRWKQGRYGSGQVLLLADQSLLVVVTEEGEVVLVAADPDAHRELARFRALKGKTWNHPVIAHGRLYVRNAAELACYQLQAERITGGG